MASLLSILSLSTLFTVAWSISAVDTIRTYTYNGCVYIKESIFGDPNQSIIEYLEKTDIINRLEILNNLINNNSHKINDNIYKMTVDKLENIINQIKIELDDIHNKIDYNNNKPKYKFAQKFNDNIEKLDKYLLILDERSKIYFDVLKLERNFSPLSFSDDECEAVEFSPKRDLL